MPSDNPLNEFGCPIYNQSGQQAMQGFEQALQRLPPELRAAFERERAQREQELRSFLATNPYNT
jgi:hypothetical protein